jgi:phage baseplate assembly protein W
MERAITLPFSIDASGSILSSNTPSKIWQSRVIAAVMTHVGERIFRPQYGGTVKASLFESADSAASLVARSIESTFTAYLKSLKLMDIKTSMDSQSGTLSVTIYYQLPNGELDQISLKSGSLTRSGDVIQEF